MVGPKGVTSSSREGSTEKVAFELSPKEHVRICQVENWLIAWLNPGSAQPWTNVSPSFIKPHLCCVAMRNLLSAAFPIVKYLWKDVDNRLGVFPSQEYMHLGPENDMGPYTQRNPNNVWVFQFRGGKESKYFLLATNCCQVITNNTFLHCHNNFIFFSYYRGGIRGSESLG